MVNLELLSAESQHSFLQSDNVLSPVCILRLIYFLFLLAFFYSVPHPEMSLYSTYHDRTKSVLGHAEVLRSENRWFSDTSSITLSSLSRTKTR